MGKMAQATTKIALALSAMPDTPPQTIVDLSKSVEDNGLAGVFMTEAGNDSLAYCLGIGQHTRTIKLGTAITNIYLRHPALLANEAAAVQEFTGGRFILGLGTGHKEMNTILGIRWASRWPRCVRSSPRCARRSMAVAPAPRSPRNFQSTSRAFRARW